MGRHRERYQQPVGSRERRAPAAGRRIAVLPRRRRVGSRPRRMALGRTTFVPSRKSAGRLRRCVSAGIVCLLLLTGIALVLYLPAGGAEKGDVTVLSDTGASGGKADGGAAAGRLDSDGGESEGASSSSGAEPRGDESLSSLTFLDALERDTASGDAAGSGGGKEGAEMPDTALDAVSQAQRIQVSWAEEGDINQVAADVLKAYRAEASAQLVTSGYFDLKGNAWGAVIWDGTNWVDIITVALEQAAGDGAAASRVRIVRFAV